MSDFEHSAENSIVIPTSMSISPIVDDIRDRLETLTEEVDSLGLCFHWKPLELRREITTITINGYRVYKTVESKVNKPSYFEYKTNIHYDNWDTIEQFFYESKGAEISEWELVGKPGKRKLKRNKKTVYKENKHDVDIHYWVEYSGPIAFEDFSTDFSYFDKARPWEKANMILWLCQCLLFKTTVYKK